MTVEDVKEQVEGIRQIAADYEVAHATEDRLYADLLKAISEDRCDNPKECAAEALKTKELDFPRYCA